MVLFDQGGECTVVVIRSMLSPIERETLYAVASSIGFQALV
jgi:hypothetical protein